MYIGAKEKPPDFHPTGNEGDKTVGSQCHAWITESGEAHIDGCVNTREAMRLIQWLKETFED